MKRISLMATILLFAMLQACNSSSEQIENGRVSDQAYGYNDAREKQEEQQGNPLDDGVIADRKLIKEGTLTYKTDNLQQARTRLLQQVQKWKGYVSSEQEYNHGDRNSTTIIIRVPANHFDSLLNAAKVGISQFDQKEIQVKDVTDQFVDIEARLKTKNELETRYTELLKMAKNVQDVLEIEKEMGTLRADIESMEGRLKYLSSQVAYATLTITLYQAVSAPQAYADKFGNGFAAGWNNLVSFLVGLTHLWPFLILGVLAFVGVKRWRKRNRKA